MLARLCAFLIWALVAATALFWGLRLFVHAPAAPAYAVAVDDSATVRGDLARLLGVAPPPTSAAPAMAPEAGARFKLLGIMAPRANAVDRQGVALIAIDGKPPRAFTVGARLEDDLVLQAVSLRTASIGPERGQSALTLEMPPLLAPSTGTLPPLAGVPVPLARFVAPVQALPPQGAPGPSVTAPNFPASRGSKPTMAQ